LRNRANAETNLIDLIDQTQACYQQLEGVATRAYSDNRLPLMAGIVVIADQTQWRKTHFDLTIGGIVAD
jgi:hypothetical protein